MDIVAINYAPEVTGIGPYTTDLAQRLAAAGWDVRVVTGRPHYPQWRPMELPSVADDGVQVERVRHSIPATPSMAGRVRMELEFGVRALQRGVRSDAVVVIASPPLIAVGLIVAAMRFRRQATPVGMWVQDLYSQAVVEAAGRRGLTVKAVRALESSVLRSVDSVAVVHERFTRTVVDEHRVDARRVVELRNWNQSRPPARGDQQAARARLRIPSSTVVAVHAGNMGVKQGLETVVAAARMAESAALDVQFYLVGDGNQRRALECAALGCGAVTFVDPLPDDEFHLMLAAADVLIVNEKPGVAEMSIPSKLTTYFGAGRPVVAAVERGGITAGEVERSGAGVVVAAGDGCALLDAVVSVAGDPRRAALLGDAGVRYAREELSAEAAVERFQSWLAALADDGLDAPSFGEELDDDRRLADYVVDKRDRGRNRVWMVLWIAAAAVLRSGVGGSAARRAVLRAFGAAIAEDARIHRSFRVHFPWKLTVGARSAIGRDVWVIDPEPVTIGSDCTIGDEVVICSGGHDHRSPTFDRTSEPVWIGSACSIGDGAILLKGVRLGDGVQVPAGAVIT